MLGSLAIWRGKFVYTRKCLGCRRSFDKHSQHLGPEYSVVIRKNRPWILLILYEWIVSLCMVLWYFTEGVLRLLKSFWVFFRFLHSLEIKVWILDSTFKIATCQHQFVMCPAGLLHSEMIFSDNFNAPESVCRNDYLRSRDTSEYLCVNQPPICQASLTLGMRLVRWKGADLVAVNHKPVMTGCWMPALSKTDTRTLG